MTTRTDHRTVTFTQPFHLDGIDGLQPAGAYLVDTDEETIDELSFVAWRRMATSIHISRNGTTQVFRIDPVDLDASLMRDAGMTVVPPARL
jgi:hypothetical protein